MVTTEVPIFRGRGHLPKNLNGADGGRAAAPPTDIIYSDLRLSGARRGTSALGKHIDAKSESLWTKSLLDVSRLAQVSTRRGEDGKVVIRGALSIYFARLEDYSSGEFRHEVGRQGYVAA